MQFILSLVFHRSPCEKDKTLKRPKTTEKVNVTWEKEGTDAKLTAATGSCTAILLRCLSWACLSWNCAWEPEISISSLHRKGGAEKDSESSRPLSQDRDQQEHREATTLAAQKIYLEPLLKSFFQKASPPLHLSFSFYDSMEIGYPEMSERLRNFFSKFSQVGCQERKIDRDLRKFLSSRPRQSK